MSIDQEVESSENNTKDAGSQSDPGVALLEADKILEDQDEGGVSSDSGSYYCGTSSECSGASFDSGSSGDMEEGFQPLLDSGAYTSHGDNNLATARNQSTDTLELRYEWSRCLPWV